jgi:hypothetical protein
MRSAEGKRMRSGRADARYFSMQHAGDTQRNQELATVDNRM